jgi:hypothetical protein
VLFTSRNKTAQGLRLKVIKHAVGCLEGEASQKVLLAGGVKLDEHQVQVALDYCGGLPLALTLLNRALVAEDDPADLIQHLAAQKTFSVDKEDGLVKALSFSVARLSEEAQKAWLDLALMYAHSLCFPLELQCLFGEHILQKLQDRALIAFQEFSSPSIYAGPVVEVVLHDVLLRVAEHICRCAGNNYCIKFPFSSTPDDATFLQDVKVCICVWCRSFWLA